MDVQKIGAFLAELRKERNLTDVANSFKQI